VYIPVSTAPPVEVMTLVPEYALPDVAVEVFVENVHPDGALGGVAASKFWLYEVMTTPGDVGD